jgi:hypothetical protein
MTQEVAYQHNLKKVNDINPLDYRRKPMEVIDKSHDEITTNRTVDNKQFIKILDKRKLMFSAMACRKLGLEANLKVHFINDDNEWWFWIDSDKDGFQLSPQTGNPGLWIHNAALVVESHFQ